jgi:hypothetical protein
MVATKFEVEVARMVSRLTRIQVRVRNLTNDPIVKQDCRTSCRAFLYVACTS